MKNKLPDARPILFPVPQDGSALAAENLPSFPAFPVGRDGNWLQVAVPALMILPVDAFTAESQAQAVADAAELLTKGQIQLSGVAVECKPLCEKYPTDTRPRNETRAELLRLLSVTSKSWVADAAETLDERGAEDARKAGAEILALLSLFQPEGLNDSPPTLA